MEKQFTASVYIVENDKVLLIYHKKLLKWLPPGGHMEPNELPTEAAIREAKEETGYDVKIISEEHLWVERWNANSFERPFMCLLEEIPAYQDKPAHQHIDFIYIASICGGAPIENKKETGGLRWFTLNEVEGLEPDKEIFEETKQTIRSLFFCPAVVGIPF